MMKLLVLAALAALCLADESKTAGPFRPDPLSVIEKLALSAITDRQKALQDDIRAFSSEVCSKRGITSIEECSIDPQTMTVTRVVKPASDKK